MIAFCALLRKSRQENGKSRKAPSLRNGQMDTSTVNTGLNVLFYSGFGVVVGEGFEPS
jgi:hypothetical protein